ncbi:ibr domain protein [Cystoisospora suis]|uniref:Ibr domain protein n=1 Tax=Cystoisospora suis TaxID=483139 RepID=A0A2C6LBS7_9APIC|nr:ibr domain protein [Cystoisospora suis]
MRTTCRGGASLQRKMERSASSQSAGLRNVYVSGSTDGNKDDTTFPQCSICLEPMLPSDNCISLDCYPGTKSPSEPSPNSVQRRQPKRTRSSTDHVSDKVASNEAVSCVTRSRNRFLKQLVPFSSRNLQGCTSDSVMASRRGLNDSAVKECISVRPYADAHQFHVVCLRQYVTFSLHNCQVAVPSPGGGDAEQSPAILRCPLPHCRKEVSQSVLRRLLLPVESQQEERFKNLQDDPRGLSVTPVVLMGKATQGVDALADFHGASSARFRASKKVEDHSRTMSPPSAPTPSHDHHGVTLRQGRKRNCEDAPQGTRAFAVASSAAIRRAHGAEKRTIPNCGTGAALRSSLSHLSTTCSSPIRVTRDLEGEALYGMYLERSFEAYVDTAGDMMRCLTPGCGYAFWWPPDAEWLSDESVRLGEDICPKCSRSCLICGGPPHKGESCDQARGVSVANPRDKKPVESHSLSFWRESRRLDVAFEEYKKAEHLRDCLQCGAVLHLESGCHRMRCRCGFKFCYVCGTPNATCGCQEVQGHGFLSLEEVRLSNSDAAKRSSSVSVLGNLSRSSRPSSGASRQPSASTTRATANSNHCSFKGSALRARPDTPLSRNKRKPSSSASRLASSETCGRVASHDRTQSRCPSDRCSFRKVTESRSLPARRALFAKQAPRVDVPPSSRSPSAPASTTANQSGEAVDGITSFRSAESCRRGRKSLTGKRMSNYSLRSRTRAVSAGAVPSTANGAKKRRR